MTSKASFLRLGYVEAQEIDGAVFLVREYAPGKHCGQLLTGGKSYVLQSVDVARLIKREEINMNKYTKAQLESKTSKELLTIYNKAAGAKLKKFQNKADAVKRTLEATAVPGARHNVMDDIREAITKGPVTIASLAQQFSIAPNTARTKLTRLKSAKYCGNGEPLNITRDGDTYSCA